MGCVNADLNQATVCVERTRWVRGNGSVVNGATTQASLNNCASWTGEGGNWKSSSSSAGCQPTINKILQLKEKAAKEKAEKNRIKVCVNADLKQSTVCVERTRWVRGNGSVVNGATTQASLNNCASRTGEGGNW